jgi:hypothetical protein
MSSKSSRFEFRRIGFLAIVLLIAHFLLGPSRGIDLEHRYSQWIGVLLFFMIWIFLVSTWGQFVSERLLARAGKAGISINGSTEALFGSLLWGSVVCAYGISFLSVLEGTPLGGALSGTLGRILVLLGFFGGACWLRLSGAVGPLFGSFVDGTRRLTPTERWCLGIVVFGFLTRFLFAARLHPHGDALLYHLLGPRSLFDRGDFTGFVENPILFQVSHWESLFQWPNLMFAREPGTGLAWVQVFAQWIHTFLGWGGSGFGIYVLLRRTRLPITVSLAIVAAALSVAQLEWTSHLAKTDWGIVFWTTGLVWLWTQKRYLESAFLAGLVFSAKVTSVFALLPLSVVALILGHHPRRPRQILAFVLLGALGCAPIWIRNAWISGNPFFPTLNEFFQSPLLAESFKLGVNKHSFFHVQTDGATWMARLKELLTQTYWSGVLLLAPVASALMVWRDPTRANGSHLTRVVLSVMALTWLTWVLFTAKVSSDAEMRWLGPALPLALAANAALLAQSVIALLPRLSLVRGVRSAAPILVFVIVVTSGIPNFAWVQWGPKKFPLPHEAVLRMRNGPAKKWLRENAAGSLALATQDNEHYYVSERRVWVSYFHPVADRIAREAGETRDIAKAIVLWKQLGVRYYLLDSGSLLATDGDAQSLDAQVARWAEKHSARIALGTLERPMIVDFGESSP